MTPLEIYIYVEGCFFIMNLQMTDRESDMLNDEIVLNEDLLLAMVMYADQMEMMGRFSQSEASATDKIYIA